MSRLYLSCSAAILWVVVAFISAAPVGAAEVKCLPDDTDLVVVVNLKQIFHSELVKSQPDALGELKEVLGEFAGAHRVQKYLNEVGIDVFRDLSSITYAYPSSKDSGPNFLILEGEFSGVKMNDAARANGATVRVNTSGSDSLYEITPRGEKRFYAVLVNPSTLLAAATEDSLVSALARASGSKKSSLKKAMSTVLESAGTRQSVTFVSSGASLARRLEGTSIPNAERVTAFLQALDTVSGGITLAKGIQFQLASNAESDDTAKKLAESANGALRILLTLVRQHAEKDPTLGPVAEVVTGLSFTTDGSGIAFRGEVSLNTLEKLMNRFPVKPPASGRK